MTPNPSPTSTATPENVAAHKTTQRSVLRPEARRQSSAEKQAKIDGGTPPGCGSNAGCVARVGAHADKAAEQTPPPQETKDKKTEPAPDQSSQASVGIVALPLMGRAVIGATEGAEAGGAAGTVEPGGGNLAGAVIGAVAGAATAALAPTIYSKTKDALKEAARRLDTAITHLNSPNKLGGHDQDPRRGWRNTVRRSADEINKLADNIANKNLANAARFTAQLLRGLVD